MDSIIKDLKDNVIEFFKEISKIPRGSKNEKAISEYIVEFAKKRGLEVFHQEELIENIPINNVVIKKPGTKGYENAKPVVLQGHMDMVCQKDPGIIHDFTKDPIELIINETTITANGTTLGADDGIGDACMLAILDSNSISHPPIEAIFTSDEEDGMSGAREFNKELIAGRRFINIDAETEGLFYYGCAGGIYAKTTFNYTQEIPSENYSFYKVEISGLLGGHSGVEINKNHANANRLLGRTLAMLSEQIDFVVSKIDGGTFPNAIPVSASAVIGVTLKDKFNELLNEIREVFLHEYGAVEKNLKLEASVFDTPPSNIIPKSIVTNLITALIVLPNDVLAMSNTIDNLVETSSNFGLIRQTDNSILLTCFIRSSVETRKSFVVEQMKRLAQSLGASFISDTDCPAWEPNIDSAILHLFKETYKKTFEKEAVVESVHAGLECGYFAKHFPDMDLIACGPTITGAHTPKETLYLETIPKILELLVNVLKEMND